MIRLLLRPIEFVLLALIGYNLVVALVAVGWVGFARLARGQALGLRSREHVVAARAMGTAR